MTELDDIIQQAQDLRCEGAAEGRVHNGPWIVMTTIGEEAMVSCYELHREPDTGLTCTETVTLESLLCPTSPEQD